jgi:hypothetical protein
MIATEAYEGQAEVKHFVQVARTADKFYFRKSTPYARYKWGGWQEITEQEYYKIFHSMEDKKHRTGLRPD